MAQISVRINDEDLAELKAQAGSKALRPLTYAAYLLTTSVRGHDEFRMKWEQLESETQHFVAMKKANYDLSKMDPTEECDAPSVLEAKFGGEDIDAKLLELATSVDIVHRGKKERIGGN